MGGNLLSYNFVGNEVMNCPGCREEKLGSNFYLQPRLQWLISTFGRVGSIHAESRRSHTEHKSLLVESKGFGFNARKSCRSWIQLLNERRFEHR